MTKDIKQQLVEKLKNYIDENYEESEYKKKVFYKLNELSGWRFYKKAILNRDWKSIKYKLTN